MRSGAVKIGASAPEVWAISDGLQGIVSGRFGYSISGPRSVAESYASDSASRSPRARTAST